MAKNAKDKPKMGAKAGAKGGPKAPKKATRRVPLPEALLPEAPGDAPVAAKTPKGVRRAESRHLIPLAEAIGRAGAEVLDHLWDTVEARRLAGDTATSHSARLLARGTAKVAQKLGEEAVECIIEATLGNRDATVSESADLLYHLIVVWVDAGIHPEEVWAELARRQGISGIAEKAARQNLSARAIVRGAGTTKLP
ncbi:phosphoribosyl-ATP diphosphatase [Roseomonas sp. CCTCC AB2023176]|uniref:phosphoribosyl-ATP diphosphatase n=1 Tax=Roseomonas sp. CCTCC AB2023176 TaxID=3342640 RepID=UPI0035E0B4F8